MARCDLLALGPAADALDAPAPAAPPAVVPPLTERMGAFRSLGGNCEFGFVQRYCGAEPSGLLRFAYAPIDDVIHALDTDLAEYGAPGDLVVEPIDGTYYYCRSRRYNIWSNTSQALDAITPEALLAREYGRVAHLKRRMLDELAAGSKIYVRKVSQGETEDDLARLARALARHGPSTLLRVRAVGPGWRPGPARRIAEGVWEGEVRRFAPTERAWDLDLEPWLDLCDAAYAAARGLPREALDAGPFTPAPAPPAALRRHRGRRRAAGLSTFTRPLDPAAFDPERVYAHSAWVWLPEGFAGARVFAVLGRERFGCADADLTVRGRWQRVWVAGCVRGEGRETVGLGLEGARADAFWSCGARVHAGPVPRPEAPPAFRPSPLARWLRRG